MLKLFYFILLGLTINGLIYGEKNKKKSGRNNKKFFSPTIFDLETTLEKDDLLQQFSFYMKSIMDFKVDPCRNFYKYACGNWPYSRYVPLESRHNTELEAISTKIDQFLVDYLSKNSKSELKQKTKKSDMKAKMFFQSCLKQNKMFNSNVKLLLKEEKALFNETKETTKPDDWITMNFLSPYGIFPLLPFNVSYNKMTKRSEIYINLPQEILNTYDDMAVLESLNMTGGKDFKDLKIALEFETNLTLTARALHEVEQITLKEFLEKHKNDEVNWQTFFREAFKGNVSDDWYVNNEIANIKDLDQFLRKSNFQTLRSYIKWRTILRFHEIWKKYKMHTLEIECLRHTEHYFNYDLISWFNRVIFDSSRKKDGLNIKNPLRNHFKKSVKTAKWLDEKVKTQALRKLNSIDITIGYSEKNYYNHFGNMTFQNVFLTDLWFKNLMNVEAHYFQHKMKNCKHMVLSSIVSPYTVKAYYIDFLNELFVTVGVFQMPFYHKQLPVSLKYGGVGFLLGREMAHIINSKSYSRAERYTQEPYQCLNKYYSKLLYNDEKYNSSMDTDHIIIDHIGAHLAYNTYKEKVGVLEGTQHPLPGTNFTNNQLFFIKLAQAWCTSCDRNSKMNDNPNIQKISPEYRILGILKNMPEFSEIFQCKLDSKMNSSKKCTFW